MTAGHEQRLAALLQPLGVYDLRPGTINRGELAAYGGALDGAEEELDHTAREMSLTGAEDFGLERIEALLPYRPVCQTAGQRRQALAALLRIGGDSFTPEAVNDTLLGCGINARAEETGRHHLRVRVQHLGPGGRAAAHLAGRNAGRAELVRPGHRERRIRGRGGLRGPPRSAPGGAKKI